MREHCRTSPAARFRACSIPVADRVPIPIRGGLDGLSDEPRPGVPRKISNADVERIIVKTHEERPKNATPWSTRSMAAATGMSQSAISRIWRASALAPAPVRDLSVVHGLVLHRQGPRRRGLLPGSAGKSAGPLRGREVSNPGPGPVPARAADDAGRPGTPKLRLHPCQHYHPVRSFGGGKRQGDRLTPPQAPGSRVQEVPGQG